MECGRKLDWCMNLHITKEWVSIYIQHKETGQVEILEDSRSGKEQTPYLYLVKDFKSA